jgi:hypothetical protein
MESAGYELRCLERGTERRVVHKRGCPSFRDARIPGCFRWQDRARGRPNQGKRSMGKSPRASLRMWCPLAISIRRGPSVDPILMRQNEGGFNPSEAGSQIGRTERRWSEVEGCQFQPYQSGEDASDIWVDRGRHAERAPHGQ